jgi:hypothetical protein
LTDPGHTHGTNGNFTIANGQGSGVSGIPVNVPGWGTYSPADWFRISAATTGISMAKATTGITMASAGTSTETRPANVYVQFIIKT